MKKLFAILLFGSFCAPVFCQDLAVTPGFKPDHYLPRNSALELRMSRAVTALDGRIAVFIDQTDVTALFSTLPEKLIYQPDKFPLPPGEHNLIVFVVSPEGGWKEIGRIPIKVLSRRGFEKAIVTPAADFTGKAQPFESHEPAANNPQRSTFEDGTVQFTVHSEHVRPGFSVKSDSQITGVTYRNEALRFGQLGDDAPPIDLSSYRIDVQRGSTVLSVGHLGFGSLRHLVNGFSSRGVALKFGEGRMFSLQLAALNGSSIVGWDNFLGLDEHAHRVLGVTGGVELIPARPNGFRLEATLFGGSLLPFSGFNEGAVRTAEKSEGAGFRLVATHPSQRMIVETGFTASTFHEARDSQVEDGLPVTPIPSRRRDAEYVDTSFVLLRNHTVRKVQTTLTISAHHERIEPLFRSVGVSTQADLQTDSADLTWTIGSLSAQLSHFRTRDNIGGVASILTTKTRRTAIGVGLPLSSVFRNTHIKAIWFPTLSAQMDLTHQFGTGVPINSDFDRSQVPDQLSRNVIASADWQLGLFRVGYRLGKSLQDNRQFSRENADFTTFSNAITVGYTPVQRLSVSIDLSLDQNESLEERRRDRTRRYGTTVAWTLFGQTALAANISNTSAANNFQTLDQRGSVGFLELSSGFSLARKPATNRQGRLFVRYSDQSMKSHDTVFNQTTNNQGATVTSGITLSVR